VKKMLPSPTADPREYTRFAKVKLIASQMDSTVSVLCMIAYIPSCTKARLPIAIPVLSQEVMFTAGLSKRCKHVLKVYGWSETDDGQLCLVMKNYVRGTLQDLLDELESGNRHYTTVCTLPCMVRVLIIRRADKLQQ